MAMREPRSNTNTDPTPVKPETPWSQSLFGRTPSMSDDQVDGDDDLVGSLPQSLSNRRREALPTVDLSLAKRIKVIFLIGRGNTGKTTVARVGAEDARAAGRQFFVAACDLGTRSLARYFEKVQTPKSNDFAITARFIRDGLAYASRKQINGIIDLGAGGETFLLRVDQDVGGLVQYCETLNIVPVFLHTVATGVDDLAIINTFQTIGLWPEASAIILNEMTVPLDTDRDTAFSLILRQSCIRLAIEKKAPQLWLPALERETFTQVERRRQSFGAAAKGSIREGATFNPLAPHERNKLKRWLEEVKYEFSPIATWVL